MTTIAAPCICLITSRRQLAPDARTAREQLAALETWINDAFGRVHVIQVREPDVDAGVLAAFVRRLVDRARGTKTRVVVNDRADIARVCGAAGVHLRSSGPPVDRVRAFGPPGWTIGRSIHSAGEAAIHGAADYLIFGTVFPSASKPEGAGVQGVNALSAAVRAAKPPVLAVGGIDPARARQCLAAGAAGIAAIGLFLPPGTAPGAMGIRPAVDALGW